MLKTITIPVFNEAETLRAQLDKLFNYIHNEKLDFNIIIVNNNSTDNTEQILIELSSIYKFRAINLKKKGVGIALRESWNTAGKNEIIGYMDLDLSTNLNNLKVINGVLKNYDILTASRLEKSSKVINRKISREIISRVFNLIVKIGFRSKLKDHMCGFKFMRSDLYLSLKDKYDYSDNWFFLVELLIIAQKEKKNIFSLPVIWKDDPNSKVKILSLSLNYLVSMLKLKRKLYEK
jgi:glycosyltransferase involved in cell wall biosynthesis